MDGLYVDKNKIECTANPSLQQSIRVVRDELLKQGDLYDGFAASIGSSLRESGVYEPDIDDISRRVIDRIIGMEVQDGSN